MNYDEVEKRFNEGPDVIYNTPQAPNNFSRKNDVLEQSLADPDTEMVGAVSEIPGPVPNEQQASDDVTAEKPEGRIARTYDRALDKTADAIFEPDSTFGKANKRIDAFEDKIMDSLSRKKKEKQ